MHPFEQAIVMHKEGFDAKVIIATLISKGIATDDAWWFTIVMIRLNTEKVAARTNVQEELIKVQLEFIDHLKHCDGEHEKY